MYSLFNGRTFIYFPAITSKQQCEAIFSLNNDNTPLKWYAYKGGKPGGVCYAIVNTKSQTWFKAKENCRTLVNPSYRGSLLSINDGVSYVYVPLYTQNIRIIIHWRYNTLKRIIIGIDWVTVRRIIASNQFNLAPQRPGQNNYYNSFSTCYIRI